MSSTEHTPKSRDIADVLRAMRDGEVRDFERNLTVRRVGKDEFRVCGDLPTSYPNTVRLLRSMGLSQA